MIELNSRPEPVRPWCMDHEPLNQGSWFVLCLTNIAGISRIWNSMTCTFDSIWARWNIFKSNIWTKHFCHILDTTRLFWWWYKNFFFAKRIIRILINYSGILKYWLRKLSKLCRTYWFRFLTDILWFGSWFRLGLRWKWWSNWLRRFWLFIFFLSPFIRIFFGFRFACFRLDDFDYSSFFTRFWRFGRFWLNFSVSSNNFDFSLRTLLFTFTVGDSLRR